MDVWAQTMKRRAAKTILWKLRGANSRARRTLRRNPEWRQMSIQRLADIAKAARKHEPAIG